MSRQVMSGGKSAKGTGGEGGHANEMLTVHGTDSEVVKALKVPVVKVVMPLRSLLFMVLMLRW
jgi:hypothetical protein